MEGGRYRTDTAESGLEVQEAVRALVEAIVLVAEGGRRAVEVRG